MSKKAVMVLIISLLAVSLVFSQGVKADSYKGKPMVVQKNIGLEDEGPVFSTLGAPYIPAPMVDQIGEVMTLGTTYNDIQHNASVGRMIQLDSEGWVHVVWMKGLDNPVTLRHIQYQLVDSEGNLGFPGGVQVNQSIKAGYAVCEVHSDGRGISAFHQQTTGPSSLYHSAMAFDFAPHLGAFTTQDLPWVYQGAVDLKVEWPHFDKDINDIYHVISTHGPDAGTLHNIYYCRAELDAPNLTWHFSNQAGNEQQELVTDVTVVASQFACSPVSERVALAWLKWGATADDTTQYDNDLYVVISEDGETFVWRDAINITEWIPPDLGLLPDTLLADKDTLRCYPDICAFFDYDDILHLIFPTIGHYTIEGTITYGNGYIWHWDENYQVYSMVANGWYENGTSVYDPGAWNIYTCRPSASIDPETGDIYCIYQRYFGIVGPSQTLPYPYLEGDTTDFSAAGWPNAEIWATKSTDGGYSWTEGINITDTHAPQGTPGGCASEVTPSAAPFIYDGKMHLTYVFDKDAGSVFQSEGVYTLNDVYYHYVPIEEIPESPRLVPYPMHCDSSGMPEDTIPPNWVQNYEEVLPNEFELGQNHPNPFNPTTAIVYSLPQSGSASLKVFNIYGQEVATLFEGYREAGTNLKETFDGSELSSGVYFYQLEASGLSLTRKMVLMK